MKILIAGAGIGGLTAGLCLAQAGHDITILERVDKLAEVGAGIQLGANAINVLNSLGLAEELKQVVVAPQAIHIRDFRSGKKLFISPLGNSYQEKFGAPYYHIHRADLYDILLNALETIAPGSIITNTEVSDFTEHQNQVIVRCANGAKYNGELLIGADGIKSNVKQQILGYTKENWTGNVAWRGMVNVSDLPTNFMETVVSNFVGPKKHMVIYYLRKQQLVNFVGVVENKEWKETSWVEKAPWEELKADFAGWHETVQSVIDHCDKSACYRWALHNHLPHQNWSTKRATLLGDAAHATLPFMASGAAMAIEDARILQRALETPTQNLEAALNIYQRNRIPRTSKIQTNSTRLGKVYHLPNRFLREMAFKTLGRCKSNEEFLPRYNANNVELT